MHESLCPPRGTVLAGYLLGHRVPARAAVMLQGLSWSLCITLPAAMLAGQGSWSCWCCTTVRGPCIHLEACVKKGQNLNSPHRCHFGKSGIGKFIIPMHKKHFVISDGNVALGLILSIKHCRRRVHTHCHFISPENLFVVKKEKQNYTATQLIFIVKMDF